MDKREKVQQDALDIAIKHKRCGLAISMGVGKTLIGLKYFKHFQDKNMWKLRVLVVAPKLSIFESWNNDAEKFNIKIDNIEFSTYVSLNKQDPLSYDILILDECHSLKESHEPFLSQFRGRILGLTGTPPKWKDSEKGRLVDKYCRMVYSYITDDAVDDKILNNYNIIVHYLLLDKSKNIKMKTKTGRVWYTSEELSYEYWSDRVDTAQSAKSKQIASILRMKQIQEYKSKEQYAKSLLNKINDKCILFANTQDQADRLCIHSYHSSNSNSEENLEKFNADKILKLSCVAQLSEGVNISNLKAGIIMHSYGNERKSAQRIGRLLRLSPDETATIHILCYRGTVDERWVKDAISVFDSSKIKYIKAYT
jgi:superfamily II DNA or RNA helicase